MDYTAIPQPTSNVQGGAPNNTSGAQNWYGSGTMPGGTAFNVGGRNGITMQGGTGLWAGGQNLTTAPFSVDLSGNLIATSATIKGNITAGSTIVGAAFQTSTTGQRITINESSNDEVLFYNSLGNVVGVLYANSVNMLLANQPSGTALWSVTGTTSFGGGGNSGISIGAGTAALNVVSSGYSEFVGSNLQVDGNLSCTGTKPFDIPHPSGESRRRLRYVAPEAPEVLVMCRGKGDSPVLPDHFVQISEPDSVQYIIGDDGSGGRNWLATAVRRGYDGFEPEYDGESAQDWPGK
jgi:hypothetical protein